MRRARRWPTPRSFGNGSQASRRASATCSAALAAGKLNKQIAADLGVVEQTVKFHRARIMERMQAKTAAELMHIAGRLGIGAPSAPTHCRRHAVAPSAGKPAKRPQA